MIGQLCGTIIDKQPPMLLLDVQGVGYEVFAPMSTFYQLPDLNTKATLLTHLVVREDAQILYGFHHRLERELFRTLIKVNGVGPKLALTILSGIETPVFVRCVLTQDSTGLVKIPGIGKKTAERLIIEMRDKVIKWQIDPQEAANGVTLSNDQCYQQDAQSALESLGYKPAEAKKALLGVKEQYTNSEQLIRLALKQVMAGR